LKYLVVESLLARHVVGIAQQRHNVAKQRADGGGRRDACRTCDGGACVAERDVAALRERQMCYDSRIPIVVVID
jgi:hypothetical protein